MTSSPDNTVEDILRTYRSGANSEIDADTIPQLVVYNKIDLSENVEPHIKYSDEHEPLEVFVSAGQNQGLYLLRLAITEKLVWIKKNNNQQQDLVYEPWKN